ncbi:MAG: ABC-type uncharacterized transport system ATPase subunit [Arenicella sp.]|jgi:ABC-type uncharacterized transport system ATPase subunit/ABC-type branched-subunit amino acid transport system permease subunit
MFEKLYHSAGLVFPLIVTIIALAVSGILNPYLAFVMSSWIIFGLLALSLDVVWGRGGLLSLAQTAFYGLGGYFGSVIAVNMVPSTGLSLLWSLPAGALFGGIIAAALGYVIFFAKMGELQSTILSYTFTLLLWSVTQTFTLKVGDAVIGGDNGFSNIPGIILGFGSEAESLGPNQAFGAVVVIAAAIYFFTRWLMRSNFGKIVDCIRIDVEKTELLGYDVRKIQVLNFSYSGVIAGVAGSLFALWANYLNPSIFSVQEALLVPIYVLVGGLGTLAGPFLGALTIGVLSFWLGGGAAGGQTTLILGVVLIFLVLFLKNGILGAIDGYWKYLLSDPNEAARNSDPVKIDTSILESILMDATDQVGSTKELYCNELLTKFGGVIPVNKVTRQFLPGKPNSLIGPNGAGKSSFLKTCVGIYRPEGGSITLDSDNITKTPIFERVRKGMGVKNQKPQIFGELTVLDNLWVAAFARTRNKAQSIEISLKILSMLGMQNQSNVEASALSHGQQQWLDIGMVLCLAPRVVLLDEPAAGMTNEETRELSSLVRTLAKHATVVVVEHDMEFVRTLAGHVTVLHQGKLFAEGDMDTLRANDAVLDIYLGRRKHV